jgi:hypothetical protein
MKVSQRFDAALVFVFALALAGCGGGAGGGTQGTTATVLPPVFATPTPGGGAPAGYLQNSSAMSASGTIVAGTQQALVAVMSGDANASSFASDTLAISTGSVSSSARIAAYARRAVAPPRVMLPEAFASDDSVLLNRLHSLTRAGSARPQSAAAPKALSAGATQELWVQKGSLSGNRVNVQVPATLQLQSAHFNIWIDDTLQFSQTQLAQIATDAENAYASDTQHFASPDYPSNAPALQLRYSTCSAGGGSTGTGPAYITEPADGRIDVMVVNSSNLGGLGGYFSAVNLMTQATLNCLNGSGTAYESNQAPFIFVGWFANSGATYDLQEDLVRSTAHELQHLINFVNHGILAPGASSSSFNGYESAYINEGLSMLAQDLAVEHMYGTQGISFDADDALMRANVYLAAPAEYSLSAFTGIDPAPWGGNGSPQYNCGGGCYGAAYLFQRYLRDRFGGDAYTHAVETSGTTGSANLQTVTAESASSLFGDFAIAMAADTLHVSSSDSRFAFGSLNLEGSYPDQFGAHTTLGGIFAQSFSGNALNVGSPVGGFAFVSMQPVPSSGAGVTVTDTASAPGFSLEGGLAQK